LDPKSILTKFWGYSSFRPLQDEIIQAVMDGDDCLALMPTGGGKSLCFQVPALAREGLCLVVTPLIALMKDQVLNLRKKGIKAEAIYSGMHRSEVGMAYDNCIYGQSKFLYLSPERLESQQFMQVLPKLKVNLIAVDEAHCISQWGYDFRPPYLRIADIRKYLPGIPILALTATATPGVVDDIQEKLAFGKKKVLKKSFERKNLSYIVVKEEDKYGRLLRVLNRIHGSTIIYVRNRRKTREIAAFLQKNRIKADHYHAGLEHKEREKKQNEWVKDQVRVMVSTNAFGMGIDKPDVRLVIHMDLPDSLEAYFQEAGRAGRDEKPAYAILLFEEGDLIKLQENFERSYPEPSEIRRIYQGIANYFQIPEGSGKDESFDFDLYDFCQQFGFNPVLVYSALKFLEREGYLMVNESFGSPSKIYFPVSREDLYRFQVENKKLDPFIKLLLRSYSGVFTEFVKISEEEIGLRSGKPSGSVVKMLKYLKSLNILEYLPRTEKPQIIFTRERLDKQSISISHEVYHERKRHAAQRLQSVVDYATKTTRCRSQLLLEYFGEKEVPRCGQCDICRERNKVGLSDLSFDSLIKKIKPVISRKPMTLQELLFEIHDVNEEDLIRVVRWLEDTGKVKKNENQRYSWKSQYKLRI
jgi:ATP-dependent DNA helicase RecQ